MTAHSVIQAFSASEENRTRLAFRTAYFSQRKMTKSEEVVFAKKPANQTLKQQLAMAKHITRMMGGTVH
jgi:hypothetical protein